MVPVVVDNVADAEVNTTTTSNHLVIASSVARDADTMVVMKVEIVVVTTVTTTGRVTMRDEVMMARDAAMTMIVVHQRTPYKLSIHRGWKIVRDNYMISIHRDW